MTPLLQRDPLPLVPVVLTATTGLVDAVSVLGLGRVFTANMTGNVVFWGFAVAGAPGFPIERCDTALTGFLAGAALGGRIGVAWSDSTRRRWLLTVAFLETGLLVAAALVATGYDANTLTAVGRLCALIASTAVAMGPRNAIVRHLAVPDLTTTVLTLTLTGLAADSALAGGSNPWWVRRLTSVASIFVGSVVGAWLVYAGGLALPLVVAGACILFVTVACTAHPASATVGREARCYFRLTAPTACARVSSRRAPAGGHPLGRRRATAAYAERVM